MQPPIVILEKLSKDRERSIEEVVGCRAVLSTIYQQAAEMKPLTESAIRGLHHHLLRHYPAAVDYAGAYKTVTNRVVSTNHDTGEERVVLEPAPPGMSTALAMANLARWYHSGASESPWALLLATEFTFRFLAIHLFKDGNGRLGRALFLLILLQSDDTHLADIANFIAIDRHIEHNKTRYYEVLQLASLGRFDANPTQYQYEPVAWFFLKIMQEALADTTKYRLRYANPQKVIRVSFAHSQQL